MRIRHRSTGNITIDILELRRRHGRTIVTLLLTFWTDVLEFDRGHGSICNIATDILELQIRHGSTGNIIHYVLELR